METLPIHVWLGHDHNCLHGLHGMWIISREHWTTYENALKAPALICLEGLQTPWYYYQCSRRSTALVRGHFFHVCDYAGVIHATSPGTTLYCTVPEFTEREKTGYYFTLMQWRLVHHTVQYSRNNLSHRATGRKIRDCVSKLFRKVSPVVSCFCTTAVLQTHRMVARRLFVSVPRRPVRALSTRARWASARFPLASLREMKESQSLRSLRAYRKFYEEPPIGGDRYTFGSTFSWLSAKGLGESWGWELRDFEWLMWMSAHAGPGGG